jgi:hypothetical protein
VYKSIDLVGELISVSAAQKIRHRPRADKNFKIITAIFLQMPLKPFQHRMVRTVENRKRKNIEMSGELVSVSTARKSVMTRTTPNSRAHDRLAFSLFCCSRICETTTLFFVVQLNSRGNRVS